METDGALAAAENGGESACKAEDAPSTSGAAAATSAAGAGGGPREGLRIAVGDMVALDVVGDRVYFETVKAGGRVKLGWHLVSLAPLVGELYGTSFEFAGGAQKTDLVRASAVKVRAFLSLRPGEEDEENDEADDPAPAAGALGAEDRNGDFHAQAEALLEQQPAVAAAAGAGQDPRTAQALTQDDIYRMRRAGRSGESIITALVKNHAAFAAKSEFSQEKYVRRKARKYSAFVVARRPSARLVCEAFFQHKPGKTSFLRPDALSLLLSYCNAAAGAHVLVVEACSGLVAAAVAERLGGSGAVCAAFPGRKMQSVEAGRCLGLRRAQAATISRISMERLLSLRQRLGFRGETLADRLAEAAEKEAARLRDAGECDRQAAEPPPAADGEAPAEAAAATMHGSGEHHWPTDKGTADRKRRRGDDGGKEGAEGPGAGATEEKGDVGKVGAGGGGGSGAGGGVGGGGGGGGVAANKGSGGGQVFIGRWATGEELQHWAVYGFNGLVVAAPAVDPVAAVQQLLPLLQPGAAFAVHCPYAQPLAEAMAWLRDRRLAAGMQLQEPWLREFQVLPGRTHPLMTMSGTGGYLLTGYAVSPVATPAAATTGCPGGRP